MIFSLMFTKMFEQAYKDFGARLPIHVRFMLDEFANMGVIPDADKKLSVMRSRNISASIVLQSISQLDKNYKDSSRPLSTTATPSSSWAASPTRRTRR